MILVREALLAVLGWRRIPFLLVERGGLEIVLVKSLDGGERIGRLPLLVLFM